VTRLLALLPAAWRKAGPGGALAGGTRSDAPGSGLAAIVRKEFADHVRSWRMAILVLVIAGTCLASLYVAAQTIRSAVEQSATPDFVFLRLFTASDGKLPAFISFLGFLAPLLGLALGFDAISGEHSRRTLSRILAQPIHRDSLINGKFLAGMLAVTVLVATLFLLTGAMGLLMIGIPPTVDEILRLLTFAVVTVIYIGFWLALSILFSVIFRQAATSALAGIAVWLFFAVFWEMLVGLFAGGGDELAALQLQQALSRLSPGTLFSEATLTLLTPSVRTLGPVVLEQVIGAIKGVLPFGQSLLLIWPQVVGLLAGMAICFAASYILFMRREVRA
jgi:ABC-2 type transport system permease protein